MNSKLPTRGVIVAALSLLTGTGIVSAELPMMTEREWLGYFVGFENKKYQFGLAADGKGGVKFVDNKGNKPATKPAVAVDFLVEELFPDGKVTVRSIIRESLESDHPATNKISQAVIRGKVTGDASFEAFLNEDRGTISLGGRIIDQGTLKNPLRFAIRLTFQEAYKYDTLDDKQKIKAFENKTKNDRLQFIRTDNKRVKQSLFDEVDAKSAEVNGPGVTAIQLEMNSNFDRRLEISATENSSMQLSNNAPSPLYKGFLLTWSADPAKDPEAKARLLIDVK
jgi:hypothetical protein